jgi:deoxyadenosine/deoxycytidine kinase
MLHDDGIVEDMEYNIYNKWYDEFIKDYRVDAVIYMDSDPEVCQRRIAKRCRQGEEGIPLNYLTKCRDYHSKWLLHNCANHVVIDEHIELHRINHENYVYPVLHVNSNVDTTYEPTNYESTCVGNLWLKTIRDFIYTLPNH